MIYHFDTEATKGYKIHAHAAFADYETTLLPERRALMERYALADVAIKVVGVGSVGTFLRDRPFYAGGRRVYVFASQAGAPLGPRKNHAAATEPIKPRPKGGRGPARVAAGKRYVSRLDRGRKHWPIGEVIEGRALDAYANLCGRTLARSHARTGDPALLAGYMGRSAVFDDALASFAVAYAAQTKHDHALLETATAIKSGLGPK